MFGRAVMETIIFTENARQDRYVGLAQVISFPWKKTRKVYGGACNIQSSSSVYTYIWKKWISLVFPNIQMWQKGGIS